MAGPFDSLPDEAGAPTSGPFDHLPDEGGQAPSHVDVEAFKHNYLMNQVGQMQAYAARPPADPTGAAQAPANALANARNAFGVGAIKNLANLGSRLIGGTTGGATEPTNLVNPDQETQPFQEARQRQDMKLQADIAQNAALAKQIAPFDPSRISGKVGNVLGQAAPMVGASVVGAGVPMMVEQGAENRMEGIENTEAGGTQISPLAKAGYLGAGGLLDATIAKFLPSPGGVGAPGVGAAIGRTGGNMIRGGTEMGIYNPLENFLASQSGVDPDRPLLQGEGEAIATGSLIAGGSHAAHEVANLKNPFSSLPSEKPAPTAQPESPTFPESPRSDAEMDKLVEAAKPKEAALQQGQPAPEENPIKSAREEQAGKLQEWARQNGKQVPEVTPGLHPEDKPFDTFKQQEQEQEKAPAAEQKAGLLPEERTEPETFFQRIAREGTEKMKSLASEESGAQAPASAGGAFLEQSLAPAVKKFWGGTKDVLKAFDRSENLGFTTSETAKKEGLGIVKAIADAKIAGKKTEAFLSPFLEHVPTFKGNEVSALHAADLMEGGNAPSPQLQPAVDHLIDLRAQNEAEARKLGWKWGDPSDPGSGLSRRFTFPDGPKNAGSGSVVGSEKFRKAQTYDTYSEAYKAVKAQGGSPEYKDPLSDQIAAQYEFNRSLKLRQRIRASEDEGNIAWSPAKEKLPDGHKAIDDKIGSETRTAAYPKYMVGKYAGMDPFEGNKFLKENADKAVYVRPGEDAPTGFSKTDHQVDGTYHAADDVAGMWNNAARTGEGDPLVKLPETIARNLTNFIWDYSPAHAITGYMQHIGKSLFDGIASVAGFKENSVRDIASDLNIFGPQTNRLLREIKSPGSDPDPKMQEIARRVQEGGTGVKTKSVLDKSHWEGVVEKAKTGNWQGAAWDTIRGLSKEIKADTYDSVLNRIAAINAKREVVNQMGKGVGAEAGQANVFKAAEAVNRGLGRHTDIPDFKDSVIARVGKLIMPAFKFRSGLVRNLAETTRGNPHAAAMVIGNLMAGAVAGTAICRIAGGRWPSSLQDIYNPPDGRKNDAGHEERISMGIWSFIPRLLGADGWGGVKAEMKGMTSPLITGAAEVAKNKDFSGNQIMPEGGSTLGNAARGVGHVAKQMLPLAAKSQMESNPEAQPMTMGERALHFAGWNAGHPVTSPAEKEAYSMLESRGETGGRTPEKAEEHANQTKWTREVQRGQGEQARQEMAADPTMTQAREKTVFERATTQNNLTRLMQRSSFGPEDLLHLWKTGNDEDQGNMKTAIQKRIADAKPKSVADRQAWIALRKEVSP